MDELDVTLDEQASARGVEAWAIASALRKAYGLDRADIVFGYYGVLQKVLKQSREEREKRESSQAKFLRELSHGRENVGPSLSDSPDMVAVNQPAQDISCQRSQLPCSKP